LLDAEEIQEIMNGVSCTWADSAIFIDGKEIGNISAHALIYTLLLEVLAELKKLNATTTNIILRGIANDESPSF